MSNPTDPDLSGSHNYAPTTAEWVTSPLMRETEVEPNPLEPTTPPPVQPGLRLAALLIVWSGLLSLGSLFVEFSAGSTSSPAALSGLAAAVFGFLTLFCPMVFAAGGIVRGILLSRSTTHRNLSQVTQFAIGGVVFLLVTFTPLVIQLVSGHGLTTSVLPTPAYWVALAGFLIMLAVAQLVTVIARAPITEQDADDDTRYQQLEDRSRSGIAAIGTKVPPMPPPIAPR